jgi:pantoate--beta-alanine ligase
MRAIEAAELAPRRKFSQFARRASLDNDCDVQVLATIASVPKRRESTRRVLVPTMGALHRGHLELIHAARDHAALGGEVAVSIFVNPLQFEPGADFERYPRPETVDAELCRSAGVDFLFRPIGRG